MDLIQAKYVLAIYDSGNLTNAAASLFISPSALNQQLQKIERELGCDLFYHARNNWRPTEAGKIYIEGARQAINIQKETLEKINEIERGVPNEITIGLAPERGFQIFVDVYPIFHHLYPDIKIKPIELDVRLQQEAIATGKIDFGFLMLSNKQRTIDNYIRIASEEIVVIIPKNHPICEFAALPGEPLTEISLSDLKNDQFVLTPSPSTL